MLEIKGGGKEEEAAVGSGGPQEELTSVQEAAGRPRSQSEVRGG